LSKGVVFMGDSERQGIGWTEGRQAHPKPPSPSRAAHRGDGALLTLDQGIAARYLGITQYLQALRNLPRHGFVGVLISISL
jgi:hypothetical protein